MHARSNTMMTHKSRSVLSRLFQLCSNNGCLQPATFFRRFFFSDSGSRIDKRPPPVPWHHEPRKVAAATTLAAGCTYAAARVRYGETEPFTGRTHPALLSHKEARERDEARFAKFKEENAYLILAPNHGDTVRVRRINDEILRAAHRGVALRSTRRLRVTDGLHWMDGLDWEVVIVENRNASARVFPGAGKIVVYAGLLHYFKTDVEIAATLAHEVGHVIGRHSSRVFDWLDPIVETLPILILFLLPFLLLLKRRCELEADQIGMMLLAAAAGVDPIMAVLVEEKFAKINKNNRILQYLIPTHPSSKKRCKFLSQPKVMEEVLELYKQVVSMYNVDKL